MEIHQNQTQKAKISHKNISKYIFFIKNRMREHWISKLFIENEFYYKIKFVSINVLLTLSLLDILKLIFYFLKKL